MKADDRADFSVLMAMLADAFNAPLSEVRLEAYFLALSDHPLERVRTAIETGLKTCRFFPVPAELLDLIEGNLEERAVEQFTSLILHARGKEHDEIDDAAWDAVEMIGGWKAIDWLTFRDCPNVDRATTRRDFLAAYRVAVKRSEPRWMLPPATPPRELPA
jgi:hypothetical protein